MRKNSMLVALSACALMLLVTAAPAQRKKTTTRKRVTVAVSGAETSLAGIKIFDSGTRVVAMFGSPNEIQAVGVGGGVAGPGGGGGGGGKAGGGAPSATPQGAPAVGLAPGAGSVLPGPLNDFDFGGTVFEGQTTGTLTMPNKGGRGGTGGEGGGSGGGGGMTAGNTGNGVVYTRWIYNRNASKYAFIMDRNNRVVQCEAIGMMAGKVRTRRGITFGSTFASIIKKYGAPDGYEIAGDNIVVRYLSKAKCAFRLSKLGLNKPDVVTGIVVAAGKR